MKNKRIRGTIRVHHRGFGFVKSPKGEIFIPKRWTQGAVDGDEVEVLLSPYPTEKGLEGSIKKILKRNRKTVVGTIVPSGKRPLAYAPLLKEGVIWLERGKSYPVGQRVIIDVKDWGSRNRDASGLVVKDLGHISDPSIDNQVAILEQELPSTFPEGVIEEAKAFGTSIPGEEINERVDLRALETATIDPATAKDFDDALSLKVHRKGFTLWVHIADVSHYVRPGTLLDEEAFLRCNSVYFPGYVIPMLPHELSSHLCSLKPDVERLAVTVELEFNKKGELLEYEIMRSVIKSDRRFSYEEALDVLEGRLKSPHSKMLLNMKKLCLLLKKERAERGSIEFALPDTQLKVDENGMPTHIEIVEYDITHQMVEEFMLKANEMVATYLSEENKPLTYRVHEEPFEENMRDFAAQANRLGFNLPDNPDGYELQEFFDEVRETPYGKLMATAFIKSMKLAIYSVDNIGHYGLGLEHYTHFTSPIRRYIDLIVHRLLFEDVPCEEEYLEEAAVSCSEQERVASRAEGRVTHLKKLRLLEKMGQKRFKAVVTQTKPFGFSFELKSFLLEGFLPFSEIDTWVSVGEEINVLITEIDLARQEVSWELL